MLFKGMKFGSTLRAYRLGFHEMAFVGFVRIRAGGPPWYVDVAPFSGVKASAGGEHVRWWDHGSDDATYELVIKTIRGYIPSEVETQVTLVLDDDGNRIEGASKPV